MPMIGKPLKRLRVGLAALALLGLGACAAGPEAVHHGSDGDTLAETETVLAAGFASIRDRYIDDVPLADITVESIRGLAAIDPALTVHRLDASIVLKRHNRTVVTATFPERQDPHTWGEVAAHVAAEAAQYSAYLARADAEMVYQAMFDGALAELDIYSRYAGVVEATKNRANREGFGGVGIRFDISGVELVVTEVIVGSPAERVGLAVGDVLLSIGGMPVARASIQEIVERLRGPVRTKVRLTVNRAGESEMMTFILERSHIVPPTVSATVTDRVMHIRVKSFNQGTARSLADLLTDAGGRPAGSIIGIVLDLRGNPGGLLKQSVEVADAFLAHGNILDTLGRHPDSIQHYEAAGRDFADGLPIIVLIDGRSASAAEIVAAALQDRLRAVVAGTASYGKGTVQTVVRLPNDGEITLTWSRFMTPSGYALHGLGVFPVVCLSQVSSSDPADIRAVIEARPETIETLGAWRSIGIGGADARRALRAKCPPQRRRHDTDLQIARSLIADRELYGKALEIATVPEPRRQSGLQP